MEELKNIIANNLIYLRKKNNLTQLELAEKINYSDNAISRWERGDVTPSIEILESMSKYYDVAIEDFFDENLAKVSPEFEHSQTIVRNLTVVFSISIIWFLTTIAYIYLKILANIDYWMIFIIAIPVSCLIAIYFSRKWGNKILTVILASIFFWSIILFLYLSFLQYNIWPLFILGAPCQSALISGYYIRNKRQHYKDEL